MAGTARDLSKGKTEVLQALLGSLAPNAGPDASSSSGKQPLGSEQAKAISDRLDVLLGGDATGNPLPRNEHGQAVNEEGFPIIEITEPVQDNVKPPRDPVPPEPLATSSPVALSETQREARRRGVDRILDELEDEERAWEEQQRLKEEANEAAARATRQNATPRDRERLKAQREMQKKMGKALLQNMAAAREREESERRVQEDAWTAQEEARTAEQQALRPEATPGARKPRKTVSFAELPKEGNGQPRERLKPRKSHESLDWGDVMPGHIKPAASSDSADPMKREVVERFPLRRDGPDSPVVARQPDSDDESDYGEIVPEDGPSDSEDTLPGDDEDESEEEPEADFNVVQDEFDFDNAQHHREIALRYHEKRATMGTQILDAMDAHQQEGGEHEWDQPEVPIEATLSREPPKPAVSRFRANRQGKAPAADRDAALDESVSISGVALPAALVPTLQKAVRVGKLEDGRLVGGPAGDSGSEDESAQEVIDMLRRGDVTNLGPRPTPTAVHERVTPLSPRAAERDSEPTLPAPGKNTAPLTVSEGSSATGPSKGRVSRFKQAQLSSIPPHDASESPLHTPLSTVDRSSPKLAEHATYSSDSPVNAVVAEPQASVAPPVRTGPATPINAPTPTSRPPERVPPSLPSPVPVRSGMPPMIVDSPSFPSPAGTTSSALPASATERQPSRFMQQRYDS